MPDLDEGTPNPACPTRSLIGIPGDSEHRRGPQAMREPRLSRRALLTTGAAALLPLPAAPCRPDPVLARVTAYRAEVARLHEVPGDIPDDEPTPALDAITSADGLPAATTQEGARAALQLAFEMHRAGVLSNAQPNLIEAALRFLDGVESSREARVGSQTPFV